MPASRILAAALSLWVTTALHSSCTVIDSAPAASLLSTAGDVGSRSLRAIGSGCESVNAPRSTCQSSAAASISLNVEAIA